MIKRMVIMLVVVGVVLGGIIAFEAVRPMIIRKAISSQPVPAQTVSTAQADYQQWQLATSAVGSLRAVNGADLAPEISGIVDQITFKSGDDVPAGALLVRLRPDDDIAHLRSLQAVADLAQIVLERDQKQLKAQAVSQATLDTDQANLKNARAQVEQQQAVIEKKFLRAPFSGRLGIRAVDLGQYLNAGTTVVTLQQLDPIYLDFPVPQQSAPAMRIGAPVVVHVDAYPGQDFPGEISAMDAKVDTSTRNVGIRATIKNPDKKLLPGMFGTVEIETGAPQRLLTVPQTAITYSTYGNTIYLLADRRSDGAGHDYGVARQTFVTTGPTRGDQIAVTSGIKAGDEIITAGQVKLRNGSAVAVNNAVQPMNDPNPTPHER